MHENFVYMYCIFRNTVINSYTNTLPRQWIKAFALEPVISRKSTKAKLEKVVNSYYSDVYNKGNLKLHCHMKTKKLSVHFIIKKYF